MVAFRVLVSNRTSNFKTQFEAEQEGGLIRSQFDLDVDGGDFPNERSARLDMLASFAGDGYKVWRIQKKQKRKDG